MKITLKWLREYVDTDWSARELVARLTMAGLEEESVEDLGARLAGIVVGRVLDRAPHPKADRLSVCRVDVGDGGVRTIVCGAPNVAAGQTVAVVLPGRALPDGTVIGQAKLRGVLSEGMICSEAELGLGPDASGILVLGDDGPVGEGLAAALGLDDVVFDFEVTPNRPDCLSVVGIAREVSTLSGQPLRLPSAALHEDGAAVADSTRVDIDDAQGCPRYVARIVRGVRVGPSPRWLRDRLRAVGQRPINNVVDVTNYVMLELGQPLHAFDLARLAGGRIVVRCARAGERLTTLDGVDHELAAMDLAIADAHRPVALAGVMGGAESEVSDATADILLESAYFDPRRVRRTAGRLGLHTEASARFERGADWDIAPLASARAAALIAELAGGVVAPGCIDACPAPLTRRRLTLRPGRAAQLLAVPLSGQECRRTLERLGCRVAGGGPQADSLEVEVPSFRPDLEREIDLVEEVGRIHGYDAVPVAASIRGPLPAEDQGTYGDQRRLRRTLAGLGLDEVITPSIVADRWAELDGAATCRLANPSAEGIGSLRTSLVPGLLDVARRNFHQRAPGVALFEVGRVFRGRDEALRVAGLMAGDPAPSPWRADRRTVDLLDLKGVVEGLLAGVPGLESVPAAPPMLRPGHAAELRCPQEVLGAFGQLDPALADAFDLHRDAYIFELDSAALFRALAARPTAYRPLPKYPPIERDLAIVLDAQIPAGRVAAEIQRVAPALVERVDLFDVYSGDSIETGKRSLAFSLRLRAADRTLADADADGVIARVLGRLEQTFGARLR